MFAVLLGRLYVVYFLEMEVSKFVTTGNGTHPGACLTGHQLNHVFSRVFLLSCKLIQGDRNLQDV